MIEILPIRLLRDEDANIYGSLNVLLGKLARSGFPVSKDIVVTAPEFHLQTVLERFDFGSNEVFEQSLNLVKKEIEKTPVPEILIRETRSHNKFLVASRATPWSVKEIWIELLYIWMEQIKQRLWNNGFYKGITEGLEPQVVIFVKKLEAYGEAFFDPTLDEVVINIEKGKLHPNDLKKINELTLQVNKKLLIPYKYEWIIDRGVRLTKVIPYTPIPDVSSGFHFRSGNEAARREIRSAVKVFLNLSTGFTIEHDIDGVYIESEKIFDLNKPQFSFEELVFKLVESASTFPDSPVFMKLADMSEGMGKVRGALRLIHQKTLFDPLCEAVLFARNKHAHNNLRGHHNIHIVIPFVRGVNELTAIKRDLAVKKLGRKQSLELWLEIAIPENVVNLEGYLIQGLDGVVLNLDELSAHFKGYDHTQADVAFYKHEVSGLLKFLEDAIKLLHKSKIPFTAYGSLSLNPEILDLLVEKGVYGLVVERYEAPSMKDLLHQAEKRMILRRAI